MQEATRPRSRVALIAATATIAVGLTVTGVMVLRDDAADVVAEVEGHEITRDELAFHMAKLQRSVQNEIQVRHEVSGGWDWEEPVEGEVPLHVLQDAALDRAVHDKHVLILAAELGLVDSVDHDDFLASMAAENDRRRDAIARGEIVYGLEEFDAQQYYGAVFTDLEAELLRRLDAPDAAPSLHVTADDLEQRLDAEPEAWTANVAVYDVRRLGVRVPGDTEARREALSRLREQVAETPVDALADLPGAEVTSERIDGTDRGSRAGPYRESIAQLARLAVGERTDPVIDGGELVVYELTGKDVDRATALTEYADRIRQTILAERLEDLITERVETSGPDTDLASVRSLDMEELTR